jgi:transposase
MTIIQEKTKTRRRTPEEKKAIVQETYQPGMSVSIIARKYGIFPSQLFLWRKHMEDGAMKGIEAQEDVVSKTAYKELEKRLKETERVLGRKTLENEILREAVLIAQKKKLISRQPLPGVENFPYVQ